VSDNDSIIDAIVEALSKRRNGQEQKQQHEALPIPYQRADTLPSIHRPGFFQRLFDPSATKKEAFEQKQLDVLYAARLKAMGHQAKAYDDMTRIDAESRVRQHEKERRAQEDVEDRYAEARAEIQKHIRQHNLVAEIADLGLDPMDEQFLIAKIVRIMMTTNGKEHTNGRE
jgi:hypothetical protein